MVSGKYARWYSTPVRPNPHSFACLQNHQQPPGGYWPPPYQGGHPPPGGYPGYPPQIPGAPMAAATESPTEKKNTPHNDSRKDGDQAAKDPPTTTNASTDDPAKAGDEKPEASGKPAGEATPGPTPPKHMMTPMYSPYSPDPLHQHPHMPPPHAYPGYPPYPHYPPPHPHFWGPPPVRAGMPQSSDRYQSDVDGREGATSPSQIQNTHKEEVEHMGCTCKKTRCLKLYCQCFGVDLYCGNNCRCLQCCNRLDHEKFRQEAKRLILSRNPSAFDTKFKKGAADDMPEAKTLAHKQGCKCRKSGCMKKVSSLALCGVLLYVVDTFKFNNFLTSCPVSMSTVLRVLRSQCQVQWKLSLYWLQKHGKYLLRK